MEENIETMQQKILGLLFHVFTKFIQN